MEAIPSAPVAPQQEQEPQQRQQLQLDPPCVQCQALQNDRKSSVIVSENRAYGELSAPPKQPARLTFKPTKTPKIGRGTRTLRRRVRNSATALRGKEQQIRPLLYVQRES